MAPARHSPDFSDSNVPSSSTSLCLGSCPVNCQCKSAVASGPRTTAVTEIVSGIAHDLYALPLEVVRGNGNTPDAASVASDFSDLEILDANPHKIQFLRKPILREEDNGITITYYEKVRINGTLYNIGDVVLLEPGHDLNQKRAQNDQTTRAQSLNSLANRGWFAKICYLYSRQDPQETRLLFHAQWFIHSSRTILQEAEDPSELCVIHECEHDLDLNSIIQKVKVRELAPLDFKPNNLDYGELYYASLWNEADSSFTAIPTPNEIEDLLLYCLPAQPCYVCALRSRAAQLRLVFPISAPSSGFSQHGLNFHLGDFVYLRPSQDQLLKIGQIKSIDFSAQQTTSDDGQRVAYLVAQVSLLMFKSAAADQEGGDQSFLFACDPRQLFPTHTVQVASSDALDGHCYVLLLADPDDIEQWFTTCEGCLQHRIETLQAEEQFWQSHAPVRALELFSGAGGLGTGLKMSRTVRTQWAVEISPSAAASYRRNHKDVIVYNVDSSIALQHALEHFHGKNPPPLHNRADGSSLPVMPRPDQVDFVYGGPPCQAFSGANMSKKVDDMRSTLICNQLSFVEFYNPDFFLLENVVGLLNFRLRAQQDGNAFVGGIQSGVVKFICRTLSALRYQVHFKVLNAAQYGAPQSRERVIFWGARRDVPLPDFPIPTHFSARGGRTYKLPTCNTLPPATRSVDPRIIHSSAPLPAITVEDAIGDLPPFDWCDPHQIRPPTIASKMAAQRRKYELGIPALPLLGHPGYPGYPEPVKYSHLPTSRYQAWLRAHVIGDKVSSHYTRPCGPSIMERVVNLPIRPDANSMDLPQDFWTKSQETGQPVLRAMAKQTYRRIDARGLFSTALTSVDPGAKFGPVIHPTQKRILTVRECARAQGIPDEYEFISVENHPGQIVEDQLRQIGNAVPVPLALALGRCLGIAVMKKVKGEEEWKMRECSPEA